MFIPPLLEKPLAELKDAWELFLKPENKLLSEFENNLTTFAGRPTALTEAKNLGKIWGGKIFFKREDLLHGGAHKLNNALGMAYLAKFMGFKNLIAETGAGQHGVATAMACAKIGLNCIVFQGKKDVERQSLNAMRMKLFGAELVAVTSGSQTLKEAVNTAMKHWVENYKTMAYCIGSVVGPSPYPEIVRYFQSVIGTESAQQIQKLNLKLDAVFACVGGGSNAAGTFAAFENTNTELFACEAQGAASLAYGSWGTLHGMETLVLQTPDRQIADTESISAGLDYPAVGPWLAKLKINNRLKCLPISDAECLESLKECAQSEGILVALESAHALAGAKKYLEKNKGKIILVTISGRGDKDLNTIMQLIENKKGKI
jgi:tryptophan synthase beta chain